VARIAGQRWRIEQRFALAKGEVGVNDSEVRRWDGWYHHMTLAMFALAYLAVLRTVADSAVARDIQPDRYRGRIRAPDQGPVDVRVDLLPLTVPELRHVLWAVGQAASAEATVMVFAWSEWRRRHEARAGHCHYQQHPARA